MPHREDMTDDEWDRHCDEALERQREREAEWYEAHAHDAEPVELDEPEEVPDGD